MILLQSSFNLGSKKGSYIIIQAEVVINKLKQKTKTCLIIHWEITPEPSIKLNF